MIIVQHDKDKKGKTAKEKQTLWGPDKGEPTAGVKGVEVKQRKP